MCGDTHAGFGGQSGETLQEQSRSTKSLRPVTQRLPPRYAARLERELEALVGGREADPKKIRGQGLGKI